MRTVLYNLWPYVLAPCMLFLVAVSALVGGAIFCISTGMSQVGSYLLGGLIVFGLLRPSLAAFRWWKWIWRFARHVALFETEMSDRVTLRYSPRIADKNKVLALLQEMESALQDLTERFGHPLGKQRFITPYTIFASRRRMLTAYLLHDCEEAETTFGYRVGGYGIPAANAIVVVQRDTNPAFVIRHEMVHLFAHYWNPAAPSLLAEGLATFVALGEGNVATTAANHCVDPTASLKNLLWGFFNISRVRQNYFLAYVFVASLIHHFGWEKFQRFYRKASWHNFAKVFHKVYGTALGDDLDFGKPHVGSLKEYARVSSPEGWPVEPAGIAVGTEFALVPGAPILASRQGSWWRAHVIEVESDDRVRVRFVGWDESWDECLSRDALQFDALTIRRP